MGSGGIGFAGTGFGSSNRSSHILKKGTTLNWQNGQSAGYLRKDYVVDQSQIIANDHNDICFKVNMAPAFSTKRSQPLIVCAPSKK